MNLNFSIPADGFAEFIAKSENPMAVIERLMDQLGDLYHAEQVMNTAVKWIMAHAGDEENLREFETVIASAVHDATVTAREKFHADRRERIQLNLEYLARAHHEDGAKSPAMP